MKSLVAEDDQLSRLLLHSILSRYGECHIVENGEEAVGNVVSALKSNEPYDLLCLDILMPVLDGNMALKEIRKKEKELGVRDHFGLKVIMITALEDFQTISQAFEEGQCEAYLTKPLNEEELIDHLKELDLI